MTQDIRDGRGGGVPASPSGHSRAEPEEVSVVPTSVPNAARYWERPYGDAGDAIDFACDHCEPEEALAFLEDWRSAPHGNFAEAWPGYMRWLKVQQDGAKASAGKAGTATTVEQGVVHEHAARSEAEGDA